MKKLLTIILGLLISLTSFTQTNEQSELIVDATIVSALSIETLTNLSLGNVSQTTLGNVVVDPKGLGLGTTQYVGINAVIGKLKIMGSPTNTINLTFPTSVVLANQNNTELTFTMDVNGSNNQLNQASSSDLTSGDDITTHATNGDYYLWIGGNLGTLTNQEIGIYSGTAIFEVSYN